jgi:formamidopyrimidine-DNA glycosylase
MPELPEVETIRRDLFKKIIGKRIIGIEVKKNSMVKGSTPIFIRKIKNRRIIDIRRTGKLLIFDLGQNLNILVHLKMTGQLVYKKGLQIVAGGHNIPKSDNKLPNKYSHIIINFFGGGRLFFNDLRQFGYMRLVDDKQRNLIVAEFGIEPLTKNFNLDNFKKIFSGRKNLLKAILLNQKLIAGIGNIYADEICFAARISPGRRVNKLTGKEIKKLFLVSEKIIKQAIRLRGTTFNDYVDADGQPGNYFKLLKVYSRSGQICKRCHSGVIKKIRLVGRGTHFCPNCQI